MWKWQVIWGTVTVMDFLTGVVCVKVKMAVVGDTLWCVAEVVSAYDNSL